MWGNEFVIVEEFGVSENCCSTSSSRDKQRTRIVTETNDQESCGKPHRGNNFAWDSWLCDIHILIMSLFVWCWFFNSVAPNFAEVYNFIGSVFDPKTTGHVKRLKEMDPINLETVWKPITLHMNMSWFEN